MTDSKKKILETLKNNAMLIILVLTFIFFIVGTGGQMIQPLSFRDILLENAYVFILATGMLLCMLTGGNIDLSCGSFVCFIGAIAGILTDNYNINTGLAILILFGIGILYGVILGGLIAYVDVPPWIATLAGYLAFRGWATALLSKFNTTSAISMPDLFNKIFAGKILPSRLGELNILGLAIGIVASLLVVFLNVMNRLNRVKKGYEVESLVATIVKTVLAVAAIMFIMIEFSLSGGVPMTMVWVTLVLVLYHFITAKTVFGRYFYTIGGNAEATRLSGVDTKVIMFIAYLNMAILTTLTGCVFTAKVQSANAFAGQNFEMDAIAGCVVGGVSAYGGSGSVFGMVIGATLIGVINQGMIGMHINDDWQKVVKGLVLLGAVLFDIVANKKNAAK